MRKQVVIVAPHMDDEIIGTFEALEKTSNPIIIFTDTDEIPGGKDPNCITRYYAWEWKRGQMGFYPSIPTKLIGKNFKYYYPDPIYELHPEHRKQGAIGEQLLRQGYDVTFYCTNMTAPYIHKVKDVEKKLYLLNEYYSDKKSLWQYDHKYFLFEGYCRYLMKG